MSWEILLFINLISATIREALSKKIADKMSFSVGLFYIMVFSQVLLYLAFFITHGSLPRFDLNVSAIGVIFVIAFSAYFAAIKISLSQSILFQSYSILVTVILTAIYLGEAKYFDLSTPTGIKVISGTLM